MNDLSKLFDKDFEVAKQEMQTAKKKMVREFQFNRKVDLNRIFKQKQSIFKQKQTHLRKVRQAVFDAEDAASACLSSGSIEEFLFYADLFPLALIELRKMLPSEAELQERKALASAMFSMNSQANTAWF